MEIGRVYLVGECGWGMEGCVCRHVLVLYCVAAGPLVPAQLLEGRLQVRTHTCTYICIENTCIPLPPTLVTPDPQCINVACVWTFSSFQHVFP